MVLEVIWFIVFWFTAAGAGLRCAAWLSDTASDTDPISPALRWLFVALFSVGITLDLSWAVLAQPLAALIDRVVPEPGTTIHAWTCLVLGVVALAAYLGLISLTAIGMRRLHAHAVDRRFTVKGLRRA